jgi:hypothetical protein
MAKWWQGPGSWGVPEVESPHVLNLTLLCSFFGYLKMAW